MTLWRRFDKKSPMSCSGPWLCAKLDHRVPAAAWHQPLPVLPNRTLKTVTQTQNDKAKQQINGKQTSLFKKLLQVASFDMHKLHVDQMKRFHIADLILMFSQLSFRFCLWHFPSVFHLLFCTSAPSVQRKCSRIFSKRRRSTFKAAVFPSTVMAELKCRWDHTVTSFQSSRPRLHIIAHFPWPVVISVISCNVS